jgi:hypothetical protein
LVTASTGGFLAPDFLHPTVKPVALVADAIKDCSRRGGLVLDPFCGSGTILLDAPVGLFLDVDIELTGFEMAEMPLRNLRALARQCEQRSV